MTHRHEAHGHGHGHGHAHAHGHAHDRGLRGFARYLRLLPVMWRSPVSTEVVRLVAPAAGERVVDLGAGMGAATVVAAARGATVFAVDPQPYMRGLLRLRGLRRRGRVTVLDGAAESIPVADASIDALFTVNTIHHWTDRAAAARELARVLRPGGRALLVDEDFDDPSHPFHDRARARRHQFDDVDAPALAAELLAAGFTRAEGTTSSIAGRPAKLIRATR